MIISPVSLMVCNAKIFVSRTLSTFHFYCLWFSLSCFRLPQACAIRLESTFSGKPLGSLSMSGFETRMATGSKLFSLLTCFHATTFTLLSIFSPIEIISTKIWETPLSWHAKFYLPVAVRVSKTRVLKLPSTIPESLRAITR